MYIQCTKFVINIKSLTMKKTIHDRFSRLTPKQLGELTVGCLSWYQEASLGFVELASAKKTRFGMLTIKYVDLAMGKSPPLDEAYNIVEQISDILGMPNPFEVFCTRKVWDKFLGYRHVANLTFLSVGNQHTKLADFFSAKKLNKVFDEALCQRQIELFNYLNELKVTCPNPTPKSLLIPSMVEFLFEKNYSRLTQLVQQAEIYLRLEHQLFSSRFMDVEKMDDQIEGVFNALVATYLQLESHNVNEQANSTKNCQK